jgi:uncharacterized protein
MKRRNPFVYGAIVKRSQFVNRKEEIQHLSRDLEDAQKIFLLSPRRFGKSSLVGTVFELLEEQGIRTVTISLSSYSSYTQFLEKFAEKIIRAGGPWKRVKDWVGRFVEQVRPSGGFGSADGRHYTFFWPGKRV